MGVRREYNFILLGIASVFVLAGIAAPQVFADSDNSPSPSIANLNEVIRENIIAPTAIDLDTNLGGFEPHVSYNPLNPANVVASQGGGLLLSLDSGATFPILVGAQVPASLTGQGYGLCGDTVTTFDSQGRLFWTYLTCTFNPNGTFLDLSITVMQLNPVTGAIISVIDVTPGTIVDDKPWIVADANVGGPNADNLYLVWFRFSGITAVMYSMSTDQGINWTAPQAISSFAVDNFAWPPHITVAPNGDVYANYPTFTCQQTGTVQVLRDTNGGLQLAAGAGFAKNPAFTSQQATVSCNVQAAGDTFTGEVFAPIPLTDFWLQGSAAAYTIADPLVAGTIYVVSNDDPDNTFASGDDGDVVMATSTDFGVNWAVTTITAGPANSLQIMPTAAIDPLGNIAVSWYDTQNGGTNGGGNLLLDLYATTSTDGGVTFVPPFKVNDNPFDPDLNAPARFPGPPQTLRIGEYNGIAVTNCLAYNDWTGNDGGTNNQEIFFDTFTIANCGNQPIGGTSFPVSTTTLLVAGFQANMGLLSLALVGMVAAGAAITYKIKSKKTEQ